MTDHTAKKQKTEGSSSNDANTATTTSKLDIRQKTVDLISDLNATLDQLEESEPSQITPLLSEASLSILELKAWQNQVLNQLFQTEEILNEQRKRRDKQELQLQNLEHQKLVNEHAIHSCQNLENAHLLKLCRSELPVPTQPQSTTAEESEKNAEEGENSDTTDSSGWIQQFLGADPMDPVQHAIILDKLHRQMNTRKKLQAELDRCQAQLSSTQQSLRSKRQQLRDLPRRLADMERASLPLQRFCNESLHGVSRQLGSERRTNLDLAQQLPNALYTLYYQLQSSLDYLSQQQTQEVQNNWDDLATLEVHNSTKTAPRPQVVLKLLIPTIHDRSTSTTSVSSGFGSGKKFAVITFEYDEASHAVTAHCSKEQDMGNLIAELFPGDTGERLHEEDSNDTNTPNDKNNDNSKEQDDKRPFNWCNYLSGIHQPFPPGNTTLTQQEMPQSSIVIVRALLRRVRSQATLNWILNAFSRKPHPLPVHPAMKEILSTNNDTKKDCSVKLVSWSEQPKVSTESAPSSQLSTTTTTTTTERVFIATLKRRSATLTLRVCIHAARYPSIPPTWEFNAATDSPNEESPLVVDTIDDTVLYDQHLAHLQQLVNQNVEDLVQPSDETTYDWILAHQLFKIATNWEEQLIATDST